jgi:hypothetical protein
MICVKIIVQHGGACALGHTMISGIGSCSCMVLLNYLLNMGTVTLFQAITALPFHVSSSSDFQPTLNAYRMTHGLVSIGFPNHLISL